MGIGYWYYLINYNITGAVMIFNVLMYAAPGEKIYRVIKTGDYKLIPIFSTIGALGCSLCLLMYNIY